VRKNAGPFARTLERADDVEQEGIVALLGGRRTPGETLIRIVSRGETRAPRFDRNGGLATT
jgi:hypothetical protein